ncbi:hypothetical protein [Pedobacter sp.]|uniref:hypothetical protein n=1 Tax=Pedobacter sp. TaxID=1411316 RepID=UPI003BA8980B
MEELAYTIKNKRGDDITYTIVEYGSKDTFDFMPNGETVRRVAKQKGSWVQISGADTDQEILDELGGFIDQHNQQKAEH